MNRRHIVVVTLFLALVILFQNCTPAFKSQNLNSFSLGPPQQDDPGTANDDENDEEAVPPDPEPSIFAKGLFVLDSAQGVHRDAAIRDYDFLDGFVWRYGWKNFETNQGEYDFSPIEHIIRKLEVADKKLVWVLSNDWPQYIADHAAINGYQYVSEGETLFAPFPWDDFLVQRYTAFISALSQHQVYDTQQKKNVALKDHSRLYAMSTGFPGVTGGSLRDKEVAIVEIPGFNRDLFVNKVLRGVLLHLRRSFPNQYTHVGFWKLKNDGGEPAFTEFVKAAVLEINTTIQQESGGRRIGFIMDNLAASRDCDGCSPIVGYPSTTFGSTLFNAKDQTFISFQALSSWLRPFNPDHESKVSFGTPVDGLNYGYETFGARLFELYSADVDNPDWQNTLRAWRTEKNF